MLGRRTWIRYQNENTGPMMGCMGSIPYLNCIKVHFDFILKPIAKQHMPDRHVIIFCVFICYCAVKFLDFVDLLSS